MASPTKIFAVLVIFLTLGSTADASGQVLKGKDLGDIATVTSTEGPEAGRYLGKKFSDIGEFRSLRDENGRHLIVAVSYNRYMHPTDTDGIYIACPVNGSNTLYRQAAAQKIDSGDYVSIKGAVDDVESGVDADNTSYVTILLKPGCSISKRKPH
jgi:hypothetical protein